MRNIKRNYFILSITFVIIILSINFVIAEFTLGNPASDIQKTYEQGEVVKGWVNISFKNQDAVSLLSGFGKSVNLLSFLEATGASYSCFPADCEDSYASSSSGGVEKTLNFVTGDEKLVGIRLTGQVDSVDSLVFNVSLLGSDGACSIPLKIDVKNDDLFEWQAGGISNELCVIGAPYGCYNEGDYTGETFLITENTYCAKTKVNSGKKFKIGADVLAETGKGGDVYFKMELNSGLETQECTAFANTSSSISCEVELDEGIVKETELEICISVYGDVDNGKYKIKYENVNSCGSAGTGKYDFPIFIYPFKYSKVNNFIFNQNLVDEEGSAIDLGLEISNYISDKYKGNCNPECIIPISFHSGETQDIILSNLELIYTVGGSKAETKIYDITKSGVLINSGFQKLDLTKANFITPFITGEGEFVLGLGNQEILREIINILSIPRIIGLEPNRAAALVPTNFIVHLSEPQDDLTYIWDFGDNSIKEISDTNQMKHIYTDTGDYSIQVTVRSSAGNSSRTFPVKVIPPEEAILEILTKDKEKIIALKSQVNDLPEWIRVEIKRILDIDSMEEEIRAYEEQYERAFNEDSYVNLMKTLLEFKVPSSLTTSQQIPNGALFLSKEQLNLDILESLGAGKIDEEQDYDTIINTWLALSLEASIEFKTYALEYDGVKEDFISYIKVTLTPNENLEAVYFIVNGDPNEIIFSDESNTKAIGEKAKAIIFNDLAETKTIEFLYPGSVEIGNFPIYIAPEFKNLDFGITPGICNFNNICEKELKENYKNCRNDCKPYLLIFLFLTGLFCAFLIIYIALQEWYKRHYESKLFPDKNQLFNLINFINNSLNQGIKRSTIFSNLKDLDWSEEQLKYAWNKFNGKRTGMWEIPVFKWVENRQVKRELEKRQNIPIQKPTEMIERAPTRLRKPSRPIPAKEVFRQPGRQNLRRLRYR
jgi:PKD repeat protein